jgi:hypothetical protein
MPSPGWPATATTCSSEIQMRFIIIAVVIVLYVAGMAAIDHYAKIYQIPIRAADILLLFFSFGCAILLFINRKQNPFTPITCGPKKPFCTVFCAIMIVACLYVSYMAFGLPLVPYETKIRGATHESFHYSNGVAALLMAFTIGVWLYQQKRPNRKTIRRKNSNHDKRP